MSPLVSMEHGSASLRSFYTTVAAAPAARDSDPVNKSSSELSIPGHVFPGHSVNQYFPQVHSSASATVCLSPLLWVSLLDLSRLWSAALSHASLVLSQAHWLSALSLPWLLQGRKHTDPCCCASSLCHWMMPHGSKQCRCWVCWVCLCSHCCFLKLAIFEASSCSWTARFAVAAN